MEISIFIAPRINTATRSAAKSTPTMSSCRLAPSPTVCCSISQSEFTELVWASSGSWLRTIRPGVPPSEFIVENVMRQTLPDFLVNGAQTSSLAKFIAEQQDVDNQNSSDWLHSQKIRIFSQNSRRKTPIEWCKRTPVRAKNNRKTRHS